VYVARGRAAGGEGMHQRVVASGQRSQTLGLDLGWCCLESGLDSVIHGPSLYAAERRR